MADAIPETVWCLVCPACNGALSNNEHPTETAFTPAIFLFSFMIVVFYSMLEVDHSRIVIYTCLWVFLVVVGTFMNIYVVPKDWKRYSPWSREEEEE
jgi:membrane protein YdbS with pleckstrin-like domain